MNCIICNSNYVSEKHKLFDDRYGYPGEFSFVRCKDCGHIFVGHKFSKAELSNMYSEYYPRSSLNLDQYKPYEEHKGFSAWFNGNNSRAYAWVPENIRILDIGCGYGESLGYHQKRGCEVYGVDCDENLQRVADLYGFKVVIGEFNLEDYENNYFDFVTLDQVIEHIENPIETLKEIGKILKSDGQIIVGTPNICGWGQMIFGKRWINWHVPYHLHYFSEYSMRIAANKAGFKIKIARSITPSDWLFYQWFHLVMFPNKGEPSIFWMNVNNLAIHQLILRKLFNVMHNLKINHFITRLFDLLGVGDSKLYILVRE